jgi:copper chaperone NosL
VKYVSKRSRKSWLTDDRIGFAARCAESLRLSESEPLNHCRGSASAGDGGIASPGQNQGALPERLSLSAHRTAEPPATTYCFHTGHPPGSHISRLRSFRNTLLSRTYKHSVPQGLLKLTAMFFLLLLVGCETSNVEPVALAPEDMCSYCKMVISEKRYAAELIDSEGQAFKFDDIGCMANFLKNKKNTAKIVAHFVMDFDERQWIKAEEAYYVRSSELATPMNGGLIAFKDRSKAQEAIDKFHGTLIRFEDLFNLKG